MPRLQESRNSHGLSVLTQTRQNLSRSSIASSATFYSAQPAVSRVSSPAMTSRTQSPALSPVDKVKRRSNGPSSSSPCTPRRSSQFQSVPMSRADSGFSEGLSHRSSSRTPSDHSNTSSQPSSSSRRHKKSQSSSSRPHHKRASKSTTGTTSSSVSPLGNSVSTSSYTTRSGAIIRPALQHRYTTSNIVSHTSSQTPYQFFQFPSLVEPEGTLTSPPHSRSHSSSNNPYSTLPVIPTPPPPPATVQYWTSEETRRLEYAAIDAASHGIRGFVNKLVPGCILPKEYKQPRFCKRGAPNENGSEDEDTGSVRRYRLRLDGERDVGTSGDEGKSKSKGRRVKSWWTRKFTRV